MQPRLHPILLLTELEPNSYKTALKDPKWLDAMKVEHTNLLSNQTWTLTSLPQQEGNWVHIGFQDQAKFRWHYSKVQGQISGQGFH